ncbi:MAG: D-cysteine desulfhydrase family protein, partial [Candidatus Bipolaricaulia bacterium]
TLKELREKIDAVPRVKLAALPTPLHELPRFSRALGGPRIFIKRDDLTGLAFGGNKTRMFEFLFAQAKEKGVDTIVGGAAVQSNYSRQLVAACNVLGLEIHLVLRRVRGTRDDIIQGNLLLDLLAGASVHVIDATREEQRNALYDLAEELKKQGKHPLVVRMANDEDLSPDVVAYIDCFCEIMEQCNELKTEPSHLYVSSSDTTQAGLELGKTALGSKIHIIGVAPSDGEHGIVGLIAQHANQAAERLGLACRVNAEDVYNTVKYVGQRYGMVTSEGVAMIKLMARTEGIFLDPVYTGKAMAALHNHIRKGKLSQDDTVAFLHTGGTPALFAYAADLGMDELESHLTRQ